MTSTACSFHDSREYWVITMSDKELRDIRLRLTALEKKVGTLAEYAHPKDCDCVHCQEEELPVAEVGEYPGQ